MEANYCQRCGNALAAGASFCANCGAAQGPPTGAVTNVGNCPNCGRADPGDGLFCTGCRQFLVAPPAVYAAGLGRRVGAWLLDIVLFFLTLVIGYLIWWLIVLGRGQTPGKQLLGIRVVRVDGTPSDWGWTFLREFGVKFFLAGVIGSIVPFAGIIDSLWAFWDKDRQAVHDKIMKTVVVDDRAYRQAVPAVPQPEF